jgi:hypothetical protein
MDGREGRLTNSQMSAVAAKFRLRKLFCKTRFNRSLNPFWRGKPFVSASVPDAFQNFSSKSAGYILVYVLNAFHIHSTREYLSTESSYN